MMVLWTCLFPPSPWCRTNRMRRLWE